MHQNQFSAGAPPRAPFGKWELSRTTLPRSPSDDGGTSHPDYPPLDAGRLLLGAFGISLFTTSPSIAKFVYL